MFLFAEDITEHKVLKFLLEPESVMLVSAVTRRALEGHGVNREDRRAAGGLSRCGLAALLGGESLQVYKGFLVGECRLRVHSTSRPACAGPISP